MKYPIYMKNSYIKEFEAEITDIKDNKFLILSDTAFYPKGGGQLNDTGKLIDKNGNEYKVIYVGKFNGKISHEVNKPGLKIGDKIKGIIDWEKRYQLMKMHTASHVLSAIFYNKLNVLITGNQLGFEKSRDDYSLENFDKEKIIQVINETNKELKKNHNVSISFLKREEALKIPGIVKLAKALPPSIEELRILKIGNIDLQADGGTHVNNTSECGTIKLLGTKNKGKNNRRMYWTLE